MGLNHSSFEATYIAETPEIGRIETTCYGHGVVRLKAGRVDAIADFALPRGRE